MNIARMTNDDTGTPGNVYVGRGSCTAHAPKSTFKTCSERHAVFYCSKECQVAGWRDTHREECQSYKQCLVVSFTTTCIETIHISKYLPLRLFLAYLLQASGSPSTIPPSRKNTVSSLLTEPVTMVCTIPSWPRITRMSITRPKFSLGHIEGSISTPASEGQSEYTEGDTPVDDAGFG
ncbi:hypothetical protein DENSPDRAFT_261895 [Dentipellis sp. KUC8613]|nr:hypothetical protein DENSPDRAFT_261895 [Dentipellis sp. KUC8613]